MKTLKLKGLKVVIYTGDIDELPMHVRHNVSSALAVDSAVGSDLNATDLHLQKLQLYAEKGMVKEHSTIIRNLRQNLYMTVNKISPKMQAFMYLIVSINGQPVTDYSQENVERMAERLGKGGLTWRTMDNLLSAFKKKSDDQVNLMFPDLAKATGVKTMNNLKLSYVRAVAKGVAELQPVKQLRETLQRIEDAILEISRVTPYGGSDGAEVKEKRAYQISCAVIASKTGLAPRELTVMEYYTNLHILINQKK
jgi:hypothetical protein